MDSLTAGGVITTFAAVLVTHWLAQRGGRQRSDQVRDELILRLNAIDLRLTEVNGDLKLGISEVRGDSVAAINQIRTDLQGSTVWRETPDRLQERNIRARAAAVNGGESDSSSAAH
jgi:hypothetical protein